MAIKASKIISKNAINEELKEKIKKLEAIEKQEKAKDIPEKTLIKFDIWFDLIKKALPRGHEKEILRADFTSRGMEDEATFMEWNETLKKYGIDITNK